MWHILWNNIGFISLLHKCSFVLRSHNIAVHVIFSLPQNVTLCAIQNAPRAFQRRAACRAIALCIFPRARVGRRATLRASSSKTPAGTCTWKDGWSSPGQLTHSLTDVRDRIRVSDECCAWFIQTEVDVRVLNKNGRWNKFNSLKCFRLKLAPMLQSHADKHCLN